MGVAAASSKDTVGVTSLPTASTRPATSDPTAAFFGVRNPPVITRMKYGPVARYQSAGLTVEACTRSSTRSSPTTGRGESVLRAPRQAGFSPELTHHAFHAVESHITGFTLWQVSMPFETQEELADIARQRLA